MSIRTINTTTQICPSTSEILLLRAAALSSKEANDSFHQWKRSVTSQQCSLPSQKILGAMYLNLKDSQSEEPILERGKSAFLWQVAQNHLLTIAILPILAEFQNRGIRSLLLKGLALGNLYYPDLGARSMDDADVLVEYPKALQAMAIMEKLGWVLKKDSQKKYFDSSHAFLFQNKAGLKCDLHWHLLSDRCYSEADQPFWKSAVSVPISGINIEVLDPTDQLFHVCVHGNRKNIQKPIYWILDAVRIIQRSENMIDWDRLFLRAYELKLSLLLISALELISKEFGIQIPALNQRKSISVSEEEIREFKLQTSELKFFHQSSLYQVFQTFKNDYWLFKKTNGPFRKATFTTYFKLWSHNRSLWVILLHSVSLGMRWSHKRYISSPKNVSLSRNSVHKKWLVFCSGNSSLPLIRHGSLLTVVTSYGDDLQSGDIVVFRCNDKEICHRIIYKKMENNKLFYLTKGDGSLFADGWIPSEQISGKIVRVNDWACSGGAFSILSFFLLWNARLCIWTQHRVSASFLLPLAARFRQTHFPNKPALLRLIYKKIFIPWSK